MNELSLNQDVIYLQGEVKFTTVTSLSQQLYRLMQPNVRALDCSGVTEVDSSIVALLLAALKLAKTRGASCSITRLPESVSRLVKLYDLEERVLLATSLNSARGSGPAG